MKVLYFDCVSGISGNMVLGALTEIIGDEDFLINELNKQFGKDAFQDSKEYINDLLKQV